MTDWQGYIPVLFAALGAFLTGLRNGATVNATERKVDAAVTSQEAHQPNVEARLNELETIVRDIQGTANDVKKTVNGVLPSPSEPPHP